jgi:hypothetical protein
VQEWNLKECVIYPPCWRVWDWKSSVLLINMGVVHDRYLHSFVNQDKAIAETIGEALDGRGFQSWYYTQKGMVGVRTLNRSLRRCGNQVESC